MKKYIYDNQEYDEIPYWIWENTSPITEKYFIAHGGIITEIPEPEEVTPIIYSKYKLKLACEKRNLWAEVKSYIEQNGKWESFLLITDVSSDNAEFLAILPTIKEAFGAELVEAVLAESIAE